MTQIIGKIQDYELIDPASPTQKIKLKQLLKHVVGVSFRSLISSYVWCQLYDLIFLLLLPFCCYTFALIHVLQVLLMNCDFRNKAL